MGVLDQIKNRLLDRFLVIKLNDDTGINLVKLDVDVCEAENHTYESMITEHAIESGSKISDHILKKPFKLKITGLISDTPLGLLKFGKDYQNMKGNISSISGGGPYRTISDEAAGKLMQCYNSEYAIEILTGFNSYKNMYIESLEFPRTPETTGGLRFIMNLKQITFAKSEIVTVKTRTKNNKVTSEKQNLGNQPKVESSLLYSTVSGG